MLRKKVARVAAAGLLIACFSAWVPAQTTGPSNTLGVGDPAPALTIAKWYKGTPVPKLETGHVYVVEFWATWCGPCRESIPHLTEMQKQYGDKVTFIGVDVFEHPAQDTLESITALAEPFVAKMGDKMDYTVAGDGPDHWMADHWFMPTGQTGIPTALVVMGDGKIGWIGHPAVLPDVLSKVTTGTWDVAAERKRNDDQAAAVKPHNDLIKKMVEASNKKDWMAVIAARDQAVAASPELASSHDVVNGTLHAMFYGDAKRAVAYVKELYGPQGLITTDKLSDVDLLFITSRMPAKTLLSADEWKEIATAVASKADHSNVDSYRHCTTYADLLWRAGKMDQAEIYQERGVKILSDYNEAHKAQLSPYSINLLTAHQARLKAMKANSPFVVVPEISQKAAI